MGKHFGLSGSTAVTGIGKTLCGLILGLIVSTEDVPAATYFISPTGADSNSGVATTSPWRTFAYAMSHTVCGDTLNLMDGVYGDGTNTGKLSIDSRTCTAGSVFTVRALNQRQARINDNGSYFAIYMNASAYITVAGLVLNSADLSGEKNWVGGPISATEISNLTIKNVVARNPNRYNNMSVVTLISTKDALVEDTEIYNFHRHGVLSTKGTRTTVRRVYCNPRTGGLPGGYANGNGIAAGDACVALYPCVDCLVENVIADGTSKKLWLAEINAAGPTSGNKILGSIGYKTNANGIYINARGTGIELMPVNTTVRNVVFYQHEGNTAIHSQSAKNTIIDRVTLIGIASGTQNGIVGSVYSGYPGDGAYSLTIRNSLVTDWSQYGFDVTKSIQTWSGDHVNTYNTSGFLPTPPSKWTNHTTSNPVLGTCVAWLPDASPLKGAGAGGVDIGANILYRYQDGVLTNVPLWNPTTGEFPHGALVAGLNDVAGQSLFDVHKRLNVNTNGCSFPASYGEGGDLTAPNTPRGLSLF